MQDLDDAKTGGGSSDRAPDMKDLIQVFTFPEKKWTPIRLYPGIVSTARYWIKTKTKDGKGTKFPTPCPSYDQETQERDSTKYDPWRDLQAAERQKMQDQGIEKEQMREKARVEFEQKWWMGAIIRSLQKEAPAKMPKATSAERKSGFKDKESDSWTAKRGVRLGKGLADKIKQLKQLNITEGKAGAKAFSVDHPKYGIDIRVYYDSKKAPADQYQVQMGTKRTPLTEEELAMLGWDLEGAAAKAMAVADDKEIKRDFESWASRNGVKVAAAKCKKKADDEDDEADEDDEDFDDEEDESPKSKKKAPPKKKGKSKPADDEEDEDDESDDEDDEDEDDDPPAKSKKKAPAKGKKKPADDEDDEDEDEDDDFDEEDEDDDPPPKKKGKAPPPKKGKKPADDEDDEDDLDDDEDEDEEEEDDPPPKKKAGAKKPVAKGKKKAPVDDDDEDDLDDDDDDDEEDEDEDDDPPPKSKKKVSSRPAPKKKAPVKGKKKPAADDDEDDFDED